MNLPEQFSSGARREPAVLLLTHITATKDAKFPIPVLAPGLHPELDAVSLIQMATRYLRSPLVS
jgi:hypothetical protein